MELHLCSNCERIIGKNASCPDCGKALLLGIHAIDPPIFCDVRVSDG